MGITMSAKRTITNAIAARYRAESKRGKQMMLDAFCRTTGYHRKYAIQLLGSWGTQRMHRIDGKPVAFVVGTPRKPHKRTRHRVYDERVHHALRKLWQFFDYQCGKRLVVLMRTNMAVLEAEPEFALDPAIAAKLSRISAATVDRLLRPDRRKLAIKGRTHTRHGPLVKHQIPIRTHFRMVDTLDFDRSTQRFSNRGIVTSEIPFSSLDYPESSELYQTHLDSLSLVSWPVLDQQPIFVNGDQTGTRRKSSWVLTNFGKLFVECCIPPKGYRNLSLTKTNEGQAPNNGE